MIVPDLVKAVEQGKRKTTMNERIYTLAEQAGATRWNDELNGNSIDFSPEQLVKFAELIVNKCINVIRADYVDLGTTAAVNNIEKHFGVEE